MKRSYSRRELYALGEPLGDSATYRKAGGLVLGDGGGGGGATPAPDKTTQTVELPEWARPYAKNILSKGAALTDINQNPYQQYGGNRIAGFSPMQMQSFQGAANINAGPRGFQENVGGYMSPYMQNVVDVEKRGAIRDYQVGNTMQQAQATQAGAFGGGREAIQRAERERGLMETLGGIQARGAQSAYDQASNQFRQGISQGMDINKLQSAYGGQMQQQAQRPLDMAYQDFQNQQNYPYKQLGFMSDMIRGMPLGQKSTSSVYEQGPGMVQTLAGLGGAAYGFGRSGLFGKEGGLMSSYADGGEITDAEPVVRYAPGGVTSQQNVEGILNKLSDQQLQQAKESALNRRDLEQAQMVDAEMAERASIRSGLGGAFNQIPEAQQEQMMAGGGIVAFAGGGTYGKEFRSSLDTLTGMKQPEPQTPEELEQGAMNRLPMLQRMMGPDVTEPFAEELKTKRTGLADQMEKDMGLAFAAKSLGLLARKKRPGESQKNQLIAGLGEAGQEFAGEVGRLKKENREADDKIRQSQLLIATAQQQRKEGMAGKALASEEKADDKRQDAFKTKAAIQEKATQLLGAQAQTEMQGENALKVAGVSAAAHRYAADKPGEIERMVSDYENRLGRKLNPEEYQKAVGEMGAARYGAKYSGPDKSFEHSAEVQKLVKDHPEAKAIGLELLRPNLTEEKKEELRQRLRVIADTIAGDIEKRQKPGAAPAANVPTSTASPNQSPLYVTAPDGKTYRFNTPAEADKFRKQIGG